MSTLKDYSLVSSGRKSALFGAKYVRGVIIRPEQMLGLFRDMLPNVPIPNDAEFKGTGILDEGDSSYIAFYYTSVADPLNTCIKFKPDTFVKYIKYFGDGLIPSDAELDGIEVSNKFTVLMLRMKSSHWPPHPHNQIPLVHLRYDLGRLVLVDATKAIENERRIRLQ